MLFDCLLDKACVKLENINKKFQNKSQCIKPSLDTNMKIVSNCFGGFVGSLINKSIICLNGLIKK